MKKSIWKIIKRVLLGIIDAIPILGSIRDNLRSMDGGEGKVDFVRIITAVFSLIVFVLLALGRVDQDTARELLDAFN
jgi:hypothetical protein